MKKQADNNIPRPTVKRLTMYLTHVFELREKGVEWIASHELAKSLCLTSSTVRQDLTYLDFSGIGRRGYETEKLERILHQELGADKTANMVIVGAGNLGRALALHEEFEKHKFIICAVFDSASRIIGKKIGKFQVKSMEELPEIVKKMKIDIGIIAVPALSAQEVANALVSAGLRGLLNFAPTHICMPEHIAVVETRIISSLQELLHLMKAKKNR